jgi:hypothetical protein
MFTLGVDWHWYCGAMWDHAGVIQFFLYQGHGEVHTGSCQKLTCPGSFPKDIERTSLPC